MDILKHLSVFNPQSVNTQGGVAIVGVGALGSALALQLAKLGVKLDLFDDDRVESHNIANQVLYGPEDIGRLKVAACVQHLLQLTGEIVEHWPQKVIHRSQLIGYHSVFVCVDSMKQRTLLKKYLFGSGVKYLVEGRMGARAGAAYLVDVNDPVQMRAYDAELYSDDDVVVEKAACGTIQSVVSTASMVASHMAWLFIDHVMENAKDCLVNEILFNTSPPLLTSRRFPTARD